MIRNENDRQLLRKLSGMTVALATPLRESGEVDVDALCRLADRTIDHGAAAVFPLGWMGEQPALVNSARREVMDAIVKHVHGKVPVIVGVSEQSLPRTLEQVKYAQEVGADIVLATAPYSYSLTKNVVLDYFRQLAAGSELPLIVYNNSEAHVPLDPVDLQTISEVQGIVGVKDYSNFLQLQRLLENVHRDEDFIVWAAEEYFVGPALLMGAKHSMLGGPGNLIADWVSRMHAAANAGQWDDVSELHRRMVAFCDTLYPLADSAYSTVKAALAILGFGSGRCVPPIPTMDGGGVERVRQVLAQFEVL